MLRLERTDLATCDWAAMDAMADRVVFQTRAWLDFVARTQRAEPVVARVVDGGDAVGWFTGLVFRRYGVRMLGSPFAGWSTSYLGFNLEPGVPRRAAWEALAPFAYEELRCQHLEVRCRGTSVADLAGSTYEHRRNFNTYTLDIAPPEADLLRAMRGSCRRNIAASARNGVVVEEAAGVDFADEYYAQLGDVFAKQGLEPPFGVERVRDLIRAVHPTGNLLLLRARDPEGRSIATGIYPGFNGVTYFWGGASWRDHQALRPNEAVMWHAIRYWKQRGATSLDMSGAGDYKAKYGAVQVAVPSFVHSRWKGLTYVRNHAERLLRKRRGMTPLPVLDRPAA